MDNKTNFIILFRGSCVDRSFIHKNELISILSHKLKNIETNAHIIDFPGPGCDHHLNSKIKNDHDFKLTPCKKTIKYVLARSFGIIGPSNMHFNVKHAYKKIIKITNNNNNNIKQITFVCHSRGAIQAFMLSNKLANNNKLKNIGINIIALDPVAGPIIPKHSKYLKDNIKNLDIFLASECRVPFMTGIIPKISEKTKLNIQKLPTSHNGIVNLKCSREEKGWRSIEAVTAKHVSEYLKFFILNKLIEYKIKIPDADLIKNKFKKINFPLITEQERKLLQNEGISAKLPFIHKKKLIIDYRFNKNKIILNNILLPK